MTYYGPPQAAAGDTPACTDALTRSVGALPVVAARAMADGSEAMHKLSSQLQVCRGLIYLAKRASSGR